MNDIINEASHIDASINISAITQETSWIPFVLDLNPDPTTKSPISNATSP